MLHILTKKEEEEHKKKLLEFVEKEYCLMYNYMEDIKTARAELIHSIFKDIEKTTIRYSGLDGSVDHPCFTESGFDCEEVRALKKKYLED